MNKISVVVPVYKCEAFIPELINRLKLVLNSITNDYEIILVNDFSPYNDWEVIKKEAKVDVRVKGLKFSKNFGQHCAINAGLQMVNSEYIVVMDGDLQDTPEEILNLYNKALEGFDIVLARRFFRNDTFFKKLGSKLFYNVLSYLTETKQNPEVANFGIYKKNVIDNLLKMEDYNLYFPTMIQWLGFNQTSIKVKHNSRNQGRSSYSLMSLLNLAFRVILSFSDKLLRIIVFFGFSVTLLSFIVSAYYIYKYINGDIVVLGYVSLITSIWLLSGLIITIIGLVGLYIGKIFDQVKGRPKFIISEKLNF